MSRVSRLVWAAVGVVCTAAPGFADEQTVLGRSLILKQTALGIRSLKASGTERDSLNTLVGDPTQMGSAGGAVLDVIVNGGSPSNRSFVLPQGTSIKGKPLWSGNATKGFKYKDPEREQGPVTSVTIKRSSRGSFSVDVSAGGKKGGQLPVLPPNPGTDGCVALKLGLSADAGDRYSLQFGPESTIKNSGSSLFSAKNPSAEGICPAPVAPILCGGLPYPTCGENCEGGGVCSSVRGPGVDPQCACFLKPCGDVCGFACTTAEDCQAQEPACVH